MKNRLRVLSAKRAWSQEDLARTVGVSRQTINAIETGKYSTSLALAFKLSRRLGQLIEQTFEPDHADLE